jgi:hypothetical protein
MAKYFTISELTHSGEASRRGIDNTPPPDVKVKINSLINNLLDPVRKEYGSPIIVNSGFRSPVLNRAVGGVANSQHVKGEAADITTGTISGNKLLFRMIQEMQKDGSIQFDQLIDEKGYSWLHVSYSSSNRNQVLHIP